MNGNGTHHGLPALPGLLSPGNARKLVLAGLVGFGAWQLMRRADETMRILATIGATALAAACRPEPGSWLDQAMNPEGAAPPPAPTPTPSVAKAPVYIETPSATDNANKGTSSVRSADAIVRDVTAQDPTSPHMPGVNWN